MIFYKHTRKREESYRRLREQYSRIAQLETLFIKKIVYSRDALTFYYILHNFSLSNLLSSSSKLSLSNSLFSSSKLSLSNLLFSSSKLSLSNLFFSSSKLFLMNASSKIDTEISKQFYDNLFDEFMNLFSNCTFETKNIKTIESINSFNSSKIDDTISITSKTSKKRKYKMKDLNENDRKLLLQKIQTKPQKNKKYKKITFAKNSLQIEYIIKYLHSYVRFEILENDFFKSTIKSFSTKFIKSTINSQITRQFVEIIKNSAKHKV